MCLFGLKRFFGNRESLRTILRIIMLSDFWYDVAMLDHLSSLYPGKFFAYAVRICSILIRYAEGAYYDAAVRGLRVAEVYYIIILDVFGKDLGGGF